MAEVKVSALTALTGANVADSDELLINDVGSPNVSKKITASELAQATQFSSRYKPLASDTIWLPAPVFGAVENSPSLDIVGNSAVDNMRRNVAWLFDTSVISETVSTYAFTPPGWATVDVYIWWSNAGAGAGDVVWQYFVRRTFVDGSDLDAASNVSGANMAAIAAPAQYIVKRSKMNATALTVTAGTPCTVTIRRRTSDAGDTLGNDAAMLAIELVRAS